MVSGQTRRRAPSVSWPLIVDMRHILAHHYSIVNLDRVYCVVIKHLPHPIRNLETLIKELEQDVGWHGQDEAKGIGCL